MNYNHRDILKKFAIVFFIIFILGLIRSNNIFGIILLIFILYIVLKFKKKFSQAESQSFNKWKNFFKRSSDKDRSYVYSSDSIGDKVKNMFQFTKRIISSVAAIIILILLAASMIVIIPAGETGVYHLFGKVRDEEVSSGFHLVNPFANITKMSIRTEEYTMSGVATEGKVKGNDAIKALTKEGLEVELDITVLYHLDEKMASDVYKNIDVNYDEKIIRPEIRAAIREITANYNAVDIYTEKRTELTKKIQNKLVDVINPRGIMVESVLLRNVTLPAGLTKSIETKLQADQEAQQMDFVLDKEKKEAERKRIQAAGQRDSQKIINESLTDKYLNYLYVNELKDREGTIYVPISPSTGMPIFKNIP
ncbi:MAG: prohibitin family protein [bacterium]